MIEHDMYRVYLVGGFNHLENISQWEGLSHILWKIKKWNHQPDMNNIYIIIYTLMYTSLPSLQDPWFLGSFDVLDSVSNLEFGLKALNLGLAGWDSIRRLEWEMSQSAKLPRALLPCHVLSSRPTNSFFVYWYPHGRWSYSSGNLT